MINILPMYLGPGIGAGAIFLVVIVLLIVLVSFGYIGWYYLKKLGSGNKSKKDKIENQS